MPDAPKPKFVEVHMRLLAEDVAEVKRRAAEFGMEWQPLLRQIIHAALRPKQVR